MTKTPNPSTIGAWTSLIRAGEHILAGIENALKEKDLPPLSWYDALLEIEKAGDDGLRPYEIRDRLLMPQYGTSRLLSRIEKAGYTQRVPCKIDGRGHVVQITPKGRAVRRLMWPIYAECLTCMIESSLTKQETEHLRALSDKITDTKPT